MESKRMNTLRQADFSPLRLPCQERSHSFVFMFLLMACALPACVPPAKAPKNTLTLAIEERAKNPGPLPPANSGLGRKTPRRSDRPAVDGSPANSEAIATVGATPIAQDQFLALLIRSRGVPVLEQFVGLAAAEEHARQRGLTVSEADIEFEYDLSLRRLSDPLASPTSEGFDRTEAERLLESILITRQMSRSEFLLSVRRNAYLRKIIAADLQISDAELQAEFEIAYGERIQIRHIQLGNLADAMRIRERLVAGEDFADLAVRYSANAASARRGGLLDPFSLRDESVAPAMRETATNLSAGQISDIIRIGEWYHVIQLEKLVPPSQRGLNSVREPLRKRIEVRKTDPHMRELHEQLVTRANVQIYDPALREAYQAVHGR